MGLAIVQLLLEELFRHRKRQILKRCGEVRRARFFQELLV